MADVVKWSLKVVTKNSPLNIRASPALVDPIVGTLPIGTVVNAYENQTTGDYVWYRIDIGKWIAGDSVDGKQHFAEVTVVNAPVPATNPKNTVEGSTSTPSTPSSIDINSTGKTDVAGGGMDMTIANAMYAETKAFIDKNKISGSIRLFGIPHQFTDMTDIRVNPTLDIGRKYIETVISEAPIVTIIPGRPNYLPDVNAKEKNVLTEFFDNVTKSGGEPVDQGIINSIFNEKDKEVRYFNFIWDYYNYMRYVNLLCGVSAIMLGMAYPIEHGFGEGADLIPYHKYDWKNYKFANIYKYTNADTKTGVFAKTVEPKKDENSMWNDYWGDVTGSSPDYVQFYFDPSSSFNESMGNSTVPSKIVGMLEGAEGMVKEWAFLSNAAAMNTINPENYKASIDQFKSKLSNGDNFLTRMLSMGSVVLTGANLVFPEIWNDSSYSKSYSVSIHLVSPYGTKEAIYLNIFVPLMHLIALAMPRQNSPNSFRAPFLVKAFARGMFNCEMGLVDSVSIEKGGGGDAWSVDGLPTEVRVTLSIRDLYSSMSMTSERDVQMFFQNQSLMEFLASSCGIDLVKPEIKMKLELIRNLAFNFFTELPRVTYESIATSIRNNIFSKWREFTTFTTGS